MTALDARRLKRIANVAEARQQAKRVLPRVLFDFVDGGAENEQTIRANRQAYEGITFRPRTATSISQPDLSVNVLGSELSMPVVLAPVGGVRLVHPDGERAVARAAGQRGAGYVLSTVSFTPLEDVAASAQGPRWFQLYFRGGRDGVERLIDRAAASDFSALVITVDASAAGNHDRLVRHASFIPMRPSVASAVHFMPQLVRHPLWTAGYVLDGLPQSYASLPEQGPKRSDGDSGVRRNTTPPTWADVEWIRRQWKGPLVVKGVLTADDAKRAIDYGANGIVVSNHGGRQLDGAPATLSALREIASAVGSQLELIVDGGVRRGTDVVKALSMGARAVLVGRPYLYGLAAAGEDGVGRVLDIFRSEIERVLCQLGCPAVRELDETYINERPGFW